MKPKLAIIGIGHLGAIHLKVLDELSEHAQIVGICDVKEERTQRLASHYNATVTTDYTTLAGQVDAVTICTPTEHHFEVARFFLEQKIHTFIEKPIATTVEEANILTELAAKQNVKLQVGHVERFNAAFESVSRLSKDPLFIECHRLNTFSPRSLDIGVVMDLMIHDIDIILGLVRSPVKEIRATGINVLTPLEDIASVRLMFENGCVCNLTASRISDDVMRKIRLFQKDTYISLDYVKQEAFIYKKQGQQISKHALPIEKDQPLKRELKHFIDCVVNDQQPIVGGVEGTEALALALRINEVIRETKNPCPTLNT